MGLLDTLISPFLSIYFKFQSKRRLPQIDGPLKIHGLKDQVTISRDHQGVPHFQATYDLDLFVAQGFIHAQDRLWQMEISRRTAKGTLSEIFGDVTLDTDRLSRTLGFLRLAKQDLDQLPDEVIKILKAYVRGVNQYIDNINLKNPLEFNLINHKPELWEIEDCLAISRLMIWQLSHAWFGEYIRAKLIDAVGEERARELELNYPEDNPIELPEDIEFNIFEDGKLSKSTGPFIQQSMGSNAWVISAERSSTGSPILANDMHLPLRLPSLWYNNHLKSPSFNVTGVSIPGLPLVLVGHNDNIAWGATLSYIDCEDLFVEQFKEEDEELYKVDDSWEKATVYRELIEVKDDITHQEKVFVTRNGPIISNFLEGQVDPMALKSKSLQPVQSLYGWFKLNKASNWDEFVDAISDIEAPSLNILYADDTNIGHYCTGRVPVRKNGDGLLPIPGWNDKYQWVDEIPFDEMPHALNPKKGYIISCNNKPVSDDYPHYLGKNWMNGYRAKRLEQFIEDDTKITLNDCKLMQNDVLSIPALELLEMYSELEISDPNPRVKQAYKIMMDWNGKLTPDSVGGTIFEVSRYMAIKLLLEKHLGPDLTQTYMGNGLHPIVLPTHEFYGHDTVVLLRILQSEDSWWLEEAGGKKKLLLYSFNRAFEWLADNIGLNVEKWKWGKIHNLEFKHPLSVKSPLDRIFNRGPYPVGGNTDTPNQMAIMPDSDFSVEAWAPSWRQIIDLGNLPKSLAMFAPGQSGQLASKHYDDLIEPFLDGDYYVQYWTRGQIENNEEGLLTLKPMF